MRHSIYNNWHLISVESKNEDKSTNITTFPNTTEQLNNYYYYY